MNDNTKEDKKEAVNPIETLASWLAAIVVGSWFFVSIPGNSLESFTETVLNFGKKDFPIRLSYSFYRNDNLLDRDSYSLFVTAYHDTQNPVSGRIIIRAYGDVFGKGGQDNNFAFADLVNAPPGQSGGFRTSFYINNPALKQENLPEDAVKMATTMKLIVEFQPTPSEKEWKTTISTFEFQKGK